MLDKNSSPRRFRSRLATTGSNAIRCSSTMSLNPKSALASFSVSNVTELDKLSSRTAERRTILEAQPRPYARPALELSRDTGRAHLREAQKAGEQSGASQALPLHRRTSRRREGIRLRNAICDLLRNKWPPLLRSHPCRRVIHTHMFPEPSKQQ